MFRQRSDPTKTFDLKCFVQSSCQIKETLCLEQAVLRTTSAPESLRQCFMLAGGWEEQRGTARDVIDLQKYLASVEISKMMGCYLPQLQPSRSPTVPPHVDRHLGQGGQPWDRDLGLLLWLNLFKHCSFGKTSKDKFWPYPNCLAFNQEMHLWSIKGVQKQMFWTLNC